MIFKRVKELDRLNFLYTKVIIPCIYEHSYLKRHSHAETCCAKQKFSLQFYIILLYTAINNGCDKNWPQSGGYNIFNITDIANAQTVGPRNIKK